MKTTAVKNKLIKKVAALEKQVAQLKSENAALKKRLEATSPSSSSVAIFPAKTTDALPKKPWKTPNLPRMEP